MAKANRSSRQTDANAEPAEPSFGEALERLEAIVEAMEEGDLPLETLLERYEEGRRLVELCQARLAAAELRLQQLERRADGSLTTRPVETETSPEADA